MRIREAFVVRDDAMTSNRNGESMVERFQRRACLEALKRRGAMCLEDVSLWARLTTEETERHLNSLVADRLVTQDGTMFTAQD